MSNVTDRLTQLSTSKRALLEARLISSGVYDFDLQPTKSTISKQSHPDTSALSDLELSESFPKIIRASGKVHLSSWIEENRIWLRETLHTVGAILFREFVVEGPQAFQNCIERTWGKATDYPGFAQGTILRRHVCGKIYTSTEYSPDFVIHLHNECAFANTWPAQICFFCMTAPTFGGETPIADSRRVLRRIRKDTLDRLTQLRILYVRNFGYGSSRTWQQAFATTDKARVEELCDAAGVICEWLDQSRLRTQAIRPPVAIHPDTGEQVWFNHINSSHISSLEPDLRHALLSEFGREGLPRNCYYGDGSDFEDDVIEEIRAAYQAEIATFSWQPGDVLMLDNMLTAHGRFPFKGQRKIVVGMAGSISRSHW